MSAPYGESERKALNDESRDRATANHETWGADEEDLLLTWDRSDDELTVMAELLGRTREACRERFHLLQRGERPSTSVRVTRITTTSTSSTATYYYGNWKDGDEYDAPWYK